ncbi:MAG: hypothetical protein RL341_1449 [Pseudomonadota bacterium]|jgi:hypothetical protein
MHPCALKRVLPREAIVRHCVASTASDHNAHVQPLSAAVADKN